MGWILFEAFVALAIAVAIVWWTFPRKPKGGDAPRDRESDKR